MGDETEADIREEVIRPFLHRLGYRRNTENNIRTEVSLRYGKRFLGRKNAAHDPVLQGRADYICEVISHGRWVVEAKAASSALTRDDAEQAHSYAAHPEIGAHYYLLSNGHHFQLFATSLPNSPVLVWDLDELDARWIEISNVLSPFAIRRRAGLIVPRPGKPLGLNLPPDVKIVGGHMTYTGHRSSISDVPFLEGLRSTITGDFVKRTDAGLIEVRLTLAGGLSQMDILNQRAGLTEYILRSADEFVSVDPEHPTIFQGSFSSHMPTGLELDPPFASKQMSIPFGMNMVAYMQATGFFKGGQFLGTFEIQQDVSVDADGEMREYLRKTSMLNFKIASEGEFEMRMSD